MPREGKKLNKYEEEHYYKPKLECNFQNNNYIKYIDTDSFIVHVKTDGIYKDITQDVETKFDISNFKLDRPLPKEKNEKVIGLMKDEMEGQIMKEFIEFWAKTYSYFKDINDEDKKDKDTKKYVIKRKLKFKNIKTV